MKITILTYGSRGDVQPFLPLSCGLIERGHQVVLAAPLRFQKIIEEHHIPFAPLTGDPEELSRRLNNSGYNFIKLISVLKDYAVNIGADVLRQTEEACQNAALIIHTFTHAVGAHTLACEKNIPDIHIQTFPMFTPTGDYPNIVMPNFHILALNYFSHVISAKISWLTSRIGFEQVRHRAELPKRKLLWPFDEKPPRLRTLILCAWSPSILPPSRDWPAHIHTTGYYFFPLDKKYQPSPELTSFLETGKPPICISFGSMINKNTKRIDFIIREALKQTNNRGIILSGWSGVENQSSNELLYLESAPHDLLLPYCKMIIHHGGAGTISAGLRAGIPTIVIPFMADQPFWGNRIHTTGVGPKPILIKKLSVKNLSQAIVEAESEVIRNRAHAIGQMIRSEDGVNKAIELIESYYVEYQINLDSMF